MRPWLGPGDGLLVLPVAAGSVKRYQIIAFCNGSSSDLTAHRVMRIKHRDGERIFVTRGDNPLSAVSMVHASQVQGLVVGKMENGRKIFFGRMTELTGYMRSNLYWRFKISFNWLIWIGLNFMYPFLTKKYVLLDSNDGLIIIKATVLGRTIGECRINERAAEYFCHRHLNPYWKNALQSRLRMMTLKIRLACKNTIS